MWKEDQEFEANWWSDCRNTYGEEEKQLIYSQKMGLRLFHNNKSPYNIDCHDQSILDVGGGPVSLLLKCVNLKKGKVIDPCHYPEWVAMRYSMAGIKYDVQLAEEMIESGWDEIYCYNVLQHVIDPRKIVEKMRESGELIRIFEWIENGISPGHPHNLTEKELNEWLRGEGKVERLNYPTLKGLAYYGVFPT